MYRDEILDLYKNPRNEGQIDSAIEAEGENPSCGDHTKVYIELKDDQVQDIKHETEGCAISTAAISVATEELKGMKINEITDLDKEWMIDKLGVEVSPMRLKCAVLGLKTIQKAITERS